MKTIMMTVLLVSLVGVSLSLAETTQAHESSSKPETTNGTTVAPSVMSTNNSTGMESTTLRGNEPQAGNHSAGHNVAVISGSWSLAVVTCATLFAVCISAH